MCYKCSSVGLTYRDCPENYTKCINCQVTHPATSFSCNTRKEIINSKKKSSAASYSHMLKSGHSNIEISKLDTELIMDTYVKSLLCIFAASKNEQDNPGSFNATLKYLQGLNGVSDFKLGDINLSTISDIQPTLPTDETYGKPNGGGVTNMVDGSLLDKSAEEVEPITANMTDQSDMGEELSCTEQHEQPAHVEEESTTASEDFITQRADQCSIAAGPSRSLRVHVKPSSSNISIIKFSRISLNSENLESSFRKGLLMFKSDEFTQEECLKCLLGNLLECKLAITKAKIGKKSQYETKKYPK